ncbi:Tn7-like element transposition protein TnsE [Clostridium sp. BL-8]|uniref:Tn7-like element transposition protein TnsE n=1 Tax=Clostridium sp. BL-8 TaxID=349938 RepID=UPI00098C1C01|nr:Tn7-like element transposition protein TnsE [Clostridium sp. BL-8]OOM79132.1 hypothetical protein CLOBL_18040 [Clostridium sp. BL-8]
MGERKKLKLDNWPFEKGKKAKLIWIGEPFKRNNKWMLDTYFNDGENTKRIIQDWANLYFLSIDKYYTDGDLRSGELLDNEGEMETININLSGIIPRYNENEWSILKSAYKSQSKTFSFWKRNVLYTIPIIEIVRAIFAPNTFMLNTILYNDAWEDYFTYKLDDRKLQIHFTNQYKISYLKNEYYNHLAWMISNEEVLKMCNDIGYNMFSKGKLFFDFNIPRFSITARVKKNKHGFTIVEISRVNQKKINIDELNIYHPSFEQREKTNEAKLRTYTYQNNKDEDRIIDSDVDGAKDYDERINNELIIHEYIKVPIVKKEKENNGKLRVTEDDDTKKYLIYDENSRTLSSEGGMKKANGIEVSALDEILIPKEFNDFIYRLKELEKVDWIERVDIRIVMLPLGRKFSYLDNGMDRRKCLIVEILKMNGNVLSIIEVQRECRLLSTLVLTSQKRLEWVYKELLNGLVRQSGKWSNEIFYGIEKESITIDRKKHSRNYLDNIMSCIK